MQRGRLEALRAEYTRALLEDVVPFWLRHSPDREYGGYFTYLDRDGSVYHTDKPMWLQARQVWLLSRLYNTWERREEWLEAARLGYRFVAAHGFDADGRMWFLTTRDGQPLRKRRYLFTEAFGVIACAQYARASGDDAAWQRARNTYRLLVDLHRDPASRPDLAATIAPKVNPAVRPARSHAMPMILMATSQELRELDSDPLYDEVIEESLEAIFRLFVHPEERALLENVGPNGERLEGPQGRVINPGHAIETSWFILREALRRGDRALQRGALDILDWSLERGWDPEYGGLFAFVDLEGRPPEQLEWDMKLWWPHTEALYALLLALHATGEARYAEWYERVHAWAFDHLADPEHGEWFGYLHRDGTPSLYLKGSLWKGCFHLPRALLFGAQLLDRMLAQTPERPAGAPAGAALEG